MRPRVWVMAYHYPANLNNRGEQCFSRCHIRTTTQYIFTVSLFSTLLSYFHNNDVQIPKPTIMFTVQLVRERNSSVGTKLFSESISDKVIMGATEHEPGNTIMEGREKTDTVLAAWYSITTDTHARKGEEKKRVAQGSRTGRERCAVQKNLGRKVCSDKRRRGCGRLTHYHNK